MTPHPDQLLLDGRTLAEAETPTPRRQPLRGYARWAKDVDALRAAWRRLQWLRARRLVARLPGAYYPERWGGYVPQREEK